MNPTEEKLVTSFEKLAADDQLEISDDISWYVVDLWMTDDIYHSGNSCYQSSPIRHIKPMIITWIISRCYLL